MLDTQHTTTPRPLRFSHIGIDPSLLIGKTLQRARLSSSHPALTLDFSDHFTVQVLVDGYDPAHRGVPKQLEMDSNLDALLAKDSINLEVTDCAIITLQDAAFDYKHSKPKHASWDQKHLAVALKLAEETPRWHCIWARMEEYDEDLGTCVFRSYEDVYLERLIRTPKKSKWRKSILQRQETVS
ncbi:hypothetical protein AGABI1DRAFT_112461 [Agaricus bisporus var. burnettii JB137-S8]|uniref:Uncharacterized protein n=1 Tax=Agaricus bisporus var. burnettii (strain JB137-S8 / ATCC MYA-4627 / FGSC 10392) TaxID=597362 RepID=K5XZ80_AGABU|nr:uncharacterized protein AGABI1DRAFT_112461 [Agaricus bisporus var. burnettii JB137-S8]EKM80715.1 hypothetical protein AGABI1DRAFT_112461 [Agaricus bisporus var. burnettii JB137-S8]